MQIIERGKPPPERFDMRSGDVGEGCADSVNYDEEV